MSALQRCMATHGWGPLESQLSPARGEHFGPEMGMAPLLQSYYGDEPVYFIKYAMVMIIRNNCPDSPP